MPLTLAGSGVISGIDFAGSGVGLAHIATSTFSAASTVSVNNCFTSTYQNYRIVLFTTTATGTVTINYRMRVGGVDDTSANYHSQYVDASSTTVSGARSASQTTGSIAGSATTTGWGVIDILRPAEAATTRLVSQTALGESALTLTLYSSAHTVSTAYDGITIYPASSTITGTVRVYGYIND